MAKLTKEQAEQLAELERLRDEPDDEPDDDGPDDGGHVVVLRGSRADSFLAELLGPSKPTAKAPARKTPSGRVPAGKSRPPAGDDGQGDDDELPADPEPPKQNRYFR